MGDLKEDLIQRYLNSTYSLTKLKSEVLEKSPFTHQINDGILEVKYPEDVQVMLDRIDKILEDTRKYYEERL